MRLFSCKVRLKGSLYNEVVKPEVTAAEIAVLRHIHGGADAVADIKPLGREAVDRFEDEHTTPRTSQSERARLMALYDPRDKFITSKLFGIGAPLPDTYDGEPNTVAEPARRTRRAAEPDALADAVA